MFKGRVVGSDNKTCMIELDNGSTFKIDRAELPEALRAVGAAVSLQLHPAGGMVGQTEARNLLNYLLQIA